ncbi:MAG: Uncharacterized protein G01um101420_579 [Parcubacteria group bacterium Gr01-1014_20]|nr:MAG: Uncharacterized protein G01um101420_579 [Parcubacteria group bacterium Gr01-1014_20]
MALIKILLVNKRAKVRKFFYQMKKFKKLFPLLILIVGMVVSISVLAQTEEVGLSNEDEIEIKVKIQVTYPIAELGGCDDKSECKAFCDKSENIESCVAFAQNHGLINQADADRAQKFSRSLKSGSTPGQCATPASCKAFCSDLTNIEVCTAWAEKSGIRDAHLDEAKKIQGYLKAGGLMPGGCTSESSCRTYCENFDHADECQAFAAKVGLNIHDGEDGPPSQKVFELMKAGRTPGGCRSKDACETYCHDQSHFEECIAFAEEAGFMKKEEAELARKSGGQGPGGCRGRECETYCNDQSHQEECFKFAEEHGLIPKEDLERAKEGFVRMKAGIENTPPEVSECLKSSLGPNIIEDIQSGKLTPGPQIGERIRECFERFGARHDAAGLFKNVPAEVSSCLSEKGVDIEKIKTGEVEFTPDMGDTIRTCFQAAQLGGPGGFGPGGPGEGPGGPANLGGFLRSAPPEVTECLQSSLGDQFEKLKSGEPPTDPAVGEKIRVCFNQFRGEHGDSGEHMFPGGPGSERDFPAGEMRPQGDMMGPRPQDVPSTSRFPEAVIVCLKSKVSEEQLRLLLRGDRPSPETEGVVGTCFSAGSSGQIGPSGTGGFVPPPSSSPGETVFSPNPAQILGNFPGPVAECIKRNLSESDLTDSVKVRSAAEICFREAGTFPAGDQFQPPPDGFTPPPDGSTQPPPSASISAPSLLGIILWPFLNLLR